MGRAETLEVYGVNSLPPHTELLGPKAQIFTYGEK